MRRVIGTTLVLLAGAAAGLVGPAAPACACSCVPVSEAEAYARASTVFAATLVRREGQVDGRSSLAPVTMVFAVDAVYKGKVDPVQEVVTAMSSASCGLETTVGERYLLHARPADGDASALQTGLCDGNRPLDGTPAVAGVQARPVVDGAGADAVEPRDPEPRDPAADRRRVALGASAGLVVLGALGFVLVVAVRRRRA
jgi:hypothetical protein